jgi:hypothetical protein
MLSKLRKYIGNLSALPAMHSELRATQRELVFVREALGRLETRQTAAGKTQNLADYEFRVFSQWGEDGIIQYLIRNVVIAEKTFIEFGVETYREANTRFLLMHDNWRGLIIDGGRENIDSVKAEDLYWRYNLTAVHAFITPSKINELFISNGVSGPIGILSIDIDGMDYWVWKNISSVSPAIVVAEYNARFGPDRSVTMPLDENFTRASAHYSMIYYGASLAALVKLGAEKGYAFVGCNSNGNNAFFVREDLMPAGWVSLTSRQGYVPCQFREGRTPNGDLAFMTGEEETKLLESLPLVEV